MKLKGRHLTIASLLMGPGLSYPAIHKVVPGDSLSAIAKETYGSYLKWKDLWAINKSRISNPDLIFPGQRLTLLNGEELTLVAQNDSTPTDADGDPFTTDADGESNATPKHRHGHPQEWRLLPIQNWEKFVFRTDPSIDPDGFDRRSKVADRVAEKASAQITIASDRIPILGEIANARSDYDRLFLGDQVFLKTDEQLQIGSSYSVSTGPQKIVSKRDSRVGFGYDLTGKIRIIGVRDGLFIGTITSIYYPIRRGQVLIPEVKDLPFPDASAAPSALEASIMVTAAAKEDLLGQEKIVFLDVGTEDGVKPGMIFRHYLHVDPHTEEDISAKDFLIEGELKVLTTQDKFSTAIIMNSHTLLHFGDELVALTDLRDFGKNQGLQTIIQDTHGKATGVNDLDQMDTSEGLGEKENHDLKQLEKWSKPNPEGTPSAIVPADEILRVDTHDHPRQSYEIGHEPAPNDNSVKSAPAPETAPVPEATPAPESVPPPTENTPPPATDTSNSVPDPTAPAPTDPGTSAPPAPDTSNTAPPDPTSIPPSP